MRRVIREGKSYWRRAKNTVPQGSVMAPIFIIYVKYYAEGYKRLCDHFCRRCKVNNKSEDGGRLRTPKRPGQSV